MNYRQYMRTVTISMASLVLATAIGQAEELVVNISAVDTFRVDSKVERVCGALAVSDIPRGDSIYIDFAELVIPIAANVDSKSPIFVMAAPITVQWTPGQQTLLPSLAIPEQGHNPHAGGIFPVGEPTDGTEIRINVTSMVTLWQQGKLPNYGLLVKPIADGQSSFSIIKDGRYNGADAKLRIVYCRP